MRVLTYDECAARIGIVRRTRERIISDGEGPAVVYVSKRRRGHLEDDFNEWPRNRRKPAPGEVAHSAEARCPLGLQNENPPLGSPPLRSTSERPLKAPRQGSAGVRLAQSQ
jgi:hypothetical protein